MRTELHNEGRTGMASSGKRKTTMAKLTRESRLRERRLDKQARKEARKALALNPDPPEGSPGEAGAEPAEQDGDQVGPGGAVQSLADA
jgi:hypothetical protein